MDVRASRHPLSLVLVGVAVEDEDVGERRDRDPGGVAAGAARALLELFAQLRQQPRRPVDRQDAVGDLAGLADRARSDRGDPDGDALAHAREVEAEAALQLEQLALVLQSLACHQHLEDLNVFADAAQRPLERHPEEVLDHEVAGGAEAEHHPALGDLLEARELLRQRGGAAREDVEDRGQDRGALGVLGEQREPGDRGGAPGFAAAGDVLDAEVLGDPHLLQRFPPVVPHSGLQSELHRGPLSRAGF